MGYTASMHASFLVVGAGLAGLTAAEQIAARLGKDCLVIDRRDHIGGNCHDMQDEHGVLVHPYGPHYFRTDSERVVNYLEPFHGLASRPLQSAKLHEGPLLVLPRQFAHF